MSRKFIPKLKEIRNPKPKNQLIKNKSQNIFLKICLVDIFLI